MTNSLSARAIAEANNSLLAFAKFLSPNDTGLTGGHQCGIYIPKNSVALVFENGPFEKGSNRDRWATIEWNGNPEVTTRSRFVYYGSGTRNEYRITNFGRGFNLLKPSHTGDLVVICKISEDLYRAFLLESDDEIQDFLDAFSIAPTELNSLITAGGKTKVDVKSLFDQYYVQFGKSFPSTQVMAVTAEEADSIINGSNPAMSADEQIVRWIDTEYKLFRHIEELHYDYVTLKPAPSLEDFVQTGLEITNRRKSRAGKSLEHHLASIFNARNISFSSQPTTEGNKKPDFIFPSKEAYHNPAFPEEKLTFLGAKTTCKDRWRQVINEAHRCKTKYLFTLQQGVSPNQLNEMHEENVILVVPQPYHKSYPATDYVSVISLEDFLKMLSEKENQPST